MDSQTSAASTPARVLSHRICARRGCDAAVKKPTGKYCSVRCCTLDPERHERLRVQAQRGSGRSMLPLARQLNLGLFGSSVNPEAQIECLCEGRDDVPAGLSRLVG